jgi:Cu(I)/Ag(I) efflux system membrane fusion protein
MKTFRVVLVLLLTLAAFAGGYWYARWHAYSTTVKASTAKERRILYYADSMNPKFRSDKPGPAPDGMQLAPVYADEPSDSRSAAAAETARNFPMGTIEITPQKQQLIGVKYGMPSLAASIKAIRAVGKVAPDEKRIAHVHTRVEGWIDKVLVDFTGKLVEKAQPLLTLYSPDLFSTQEEFLLAVKSKDIMKASTLEGALGQSDSLIAASRRRLQLWDLSDGEIDEIARTGKPVTNITVFSPASGYVMARNAFPKQHITSDTELYTITDLTRVWIIADVFEADASLIKADQLVTMESSYGLPGPLKGRVDYIQPQVDPVTRTLKIRIDAENPHMALKPDMFVDVNFRIPLPRQITVPADAVLDSGLRKTVFVDRGNGYLEPREVHTGEHLGDRIEILDGLKATERIVVSGTFLIDSESQLKSAASGMGGMPGMPGMAAPKSEPAVKPKPQNIPAGKAQDMPDMPGMGKSK